MSFISLVVFEILIISDRTFYSGQTCIYIYENIWKCVNMLWLQWHVKCWQFNVEILPLGLWFVDYSRARNSLFRCCALYLNGLRIGRVIIHNIRGLNLKLYLSLDLFFALNLQKLYPKWHTEGSFIRPLLLESNGKE